MKTHITSMLGIAVNAKSTSLVMLKPSLVRIKVSRALLAIVQALTQSLSALGAAIILITGYPTLTQSKSHTQDVVGVKFIRDSTLLTIV